MDVDDDGLPLDKVGSWVFDKHDRLRRYIDITHATRRKYVDRAGAAYIDLFCGSGRAIVRDSEQRIDGSPLVAFKSAAERGVPFSELHIGDIDESKCRAAEERMCRAGASPVCHIGKAEDTIVEIVRSLNPDGLHFAFLDPYSLDLPFSVFEQLSKLKRIDILVHVSAQDLQRNLDSYLAPGDPRLDRFAPGWRDHVDVRQSQPAIRADLLRYWMVRMKALGLPSAEGVELISAPSRNQRLYWLVLASRHRLAKELWDKIRNITGQGQLPL